VGGVRSLASVAIRAWHFSQSNLPDLALSLDGRLADVDEVGERREVHHVPREERHLASSRVRSALRRLRNFTSVSLVAASDDERARRVERLGIVEATFDPLPVDAAVAREWDRLAAALVARGGKRRRRALDLVIAATANVHQAARF